MSKSKIMAIVVAAVVAVTGVGVGIGVLRNRLSSSTEETTTAVEESMTEVSTEAQTEPEETETVEETVTNENGEVVTQSDGKVVTTIKTVKKTVQNANKKANSGNTGKTTKKTTKKVTESGVWYVDALNRGLTNMEQQAVLGYSYDSEGDYFYTDDKDCWQYGYGYNEVYDQAAGFSVMFIDKLRIRFDYDNKAYMIQLWKGQYGWVFVGAEIGVYTTDQFKTAQIDAAGINHYQCADKSDWLNMSMDVYWDSNKNGSYDRIFSRPYAPYWWCTGFKFGTLNRFSSPITELIMKARITFKTATQASLFTTGMKNAGFRGASSAKSLSNDSIYQNGSDVYFRWYSALSAYGAAVNGGGNGNSNNNNNNNNNNNTTTTVAGNNNGTTTTTKSGGSIWDIFTTPPTTGTTAAPTQTQPTKVSESAKPD